MPTKTRESIPSSRSAVAVKMEQQGPKTTKIKKYMKQ
jgi:hypothetical protein